MLQKTNSNIISEHQRFGLRKLNVGVASVLLGATATYFVLNNAQTIHADTIEQTTVQNQNGGGRASTQIS